MAVDICLVLRSEHRRFDQLAQRCARTSRGFHDPVAELRQELAVHVQAAARDVYPAAVGMSENWPALALEAVRDTAESPDATADELVAAARKLVLLEEDAVIPALQDGLEVNGRRRLGKVFRMRRDALVRANGSRRRPPSQTELYELAKRAGVAQRSKMTQAELAEAVDRSVTYRTLR